MGCSVIDPKKGFQTILSLNANNLLDYMQCIIFGHLKIVVDN